MHANKSQAEVTKIFLHVTGIPDSESASLNAISIPLLILKLALSFNIKQYQHLNSTHRLVFYFGFLFSIFVSILFSLLNQL